MTSLTSPTQSGHWRLDAIHSTIGFAIRHAGVNVFRGEFKDPHGGLDVVADGTATLTGSAAVAGVAVNDDDLKAHLLSADFFDAEAYPDITFASDPFPIADDGPLSVTGTLTIRGTSQPVTATGTITTGAIDLYGNARVGVSLETTVNRNDFGISWNADLPSGQPALAPDVAVVVDLAFARPAS
jgi:polyisoprenoid-binding protein YceI